MTVTAADVDALARTVYGEARGEPMPGKVAVAWCIRNRVELDLHDDGKPDWWGEGYTAVCRKPWQFSCWNANDPNLPKLKAVTLDNPDFRDCMLAALQVIQGHVKDPTGGATHYVAWQSIAPPAWTKDAESTGRIYKHEFFRGVG